MYRRSLSTAFAALALATICVAATSTAFVDRVSWCIRRAWTAFADLGRWLVVKLPRTAQWLRPDIGVRINKDGGISMRQVPRRRPMVMPRFRMCPST